jgi:hypothetical protein
VSTPLPKGEVAFAEHSAAGDATELVSAAAGGLGDGNQSFAHPASKSDVPTVARVAHRIVSAPGPPPDRCQEVVDSRRRRPKRRDAQPSHSRTRPSSGDPCSELACRARRDRGGAYWPQPDAIWPEFWFQAPLLLSLDELARGRVVSIDDTQVSLRKHHVVDMAVRSPPHRTCRAGNRCGWT